MLLCVEMGHVIGIGTVWTLHNVYVTNSGRYNGTFGVEAYENEYDQPNVGYMPVELEGGAGTGTSNIKEGGGRQDFFVSLIVVVVFTCSQPTVISTSAVRLARVRV